ncbi:hypothetical protein WICPIJ_009606 [Wickerhamomyces pijperi]|uniref:triacylglycerol lipase n=1 Tax=Wickerhamomyces pijperi TaxID=599730 RepID=A0A9P8PMN6_WICPI|nr:hypothetical protein WICPIJ_009606 [Wickerhamomyces pijperi]
MSKLRHLLIGLSFFISSLQATPLEYSQSVFDTLEYNAMWPRISYCTFLAELTEGDLQHNCPQMLFCNSEEAKDIEMVKVFHPDTGYTDISCTAVVLAHHLKKQIILAFRGSFSVGDWLTDFQFKQSRYSRILKGPVVIETPLEADDGVNASAVDYVCEGCTVHGGVFEQLKLKLTNMYKVAKPYIDDGYQLVVTGHSLGGGYATIAGFELLLHGEKPLTIAYSSLRVANPALNEHIDKLYQTEKLLQDIANGLDLPYPSFSRVYQSSDLIPRLPPFRDYTHSGLDFEMDKLRLPHKKEDLIFNGKSDNHKNSAFRFDPTDVLKYFIAYQHMYLFFRIPWPCNDDDLPFVKESFEGLDSFF